MMSPDDFLNASDYAAIGDSENLQDSVFNEAFYAIYEIVHALVLTFIITVSGILANLINVIVFAQLGFSSTMNITLLGLSLSDIGTLIFVMEFFYLNPRFYPRNSPAIEPSLMTLTCGMTYGWLARVTRCITAFAVMERYLCIADPLKVKAILTQRRTVVIIICIYVLMAASSLPAVYIFFTPLKNQSLEDLAESTRMLYVSYIMIYFNGLLVESGSYLLIAIATILLIVELNRKSNWRQQASTQSNAQSRKDREIAKMVVLVSVVFMVFNAPPTFTYLVSIIYPEDYSNNPKLYSIVQQLAALVQCVSCTVNTSVYFRVSSKFRQAFLSIFCKFTRKMENQ